MLGSRAARLLLAFLPVLASAEDGPAYFEKNIRPVLVRQCLSCHSAQSQPVMGNLRLDTRELALKGGTRGAAIVPGNPNESLLLKAVLHTAGPLKMPPGPKMKDADAVLLAEWIRMGAPWGNSTAVSTAQKKAKFWAFTPPVMPAVPAVKNSKWVRSPIDAFILAGLEAKGLAPAKAADKRTLIRRATYDLTGLPPTPAEVEAFLADSSADAYPKLIDRLLASPGYGERWGRHWLDVARYADSNGLDENLVYKNAYRYRDYVIAAFNADKPFNEFLTEQIAGDLLPSGGDGQRQYELWTATGFLTLGAKMLAEDDPVKMEMDIVDEQLDTTMRAFLGLTVGCARCHDHKFDPIPTADYYSLAGIFKSTKTMENFKVVAKWHEYVLAPKADRDRLAAHEASIEAKRKEIGRIVKRENDSLATVAMNRVGAYLKAAAHLERDSKVQIAPIESAPNAIIREAASFDQGNVPKVLEKKKTNAPKDSKGPYFAEFRVKIEAAGNYQIDVFNQEVGAGTTDLHVNGVWMKAGAPPVQNREASPEAGGWRYLAIVPLAAGENMIRLEHATRFPYFEKLLIAPHTLAETPLTAVQIAARYQVNPGYLDQLIDYFDRSQAALASVLYAWEALANNAPRSAWVSPAAALFTNTPATADAVAARYEMLFRQALQEGKETKDPGLKALHEFLTEKFGPFRAPENARRYYAQPVRDELAKLDAEVKALEAATPEFPHAMGVREGDSIADLKIHVRGSHWTLGESVPRRFLSAVSTSSTPAIPEKESGRLQLAQWMTAKDHPLTSRVMANRIWRWHFGRGLVATVDNFGRLGEAPSNQPLLDWLALTFIEKGWSIKSMHRLLMLSNTYQQSSDHSAAGVEADPENILLWRMPRRRLEVEAIRDALISVSGAMTDSRGGSLLTYKDRQYVANTSRGGSIDYDRPIRSVYVPVIRSSMYDVFSAFDLPDPSTSNGDRDSTVVAPQALFMMNSSLILKHSRTLADKLLADTAIDDAARIRLAYEKALARPASPAEIDEALTFVARAQKEWNGDRAKGWQSFCKSLLASNEFIYLN